MLQKNFYIIYYILLIIIFNFIISYYSITNGWYKKNVIEISINSPPKWVFGLVWLILYIEFGIIWLYIYKYVDKYINILFIINLFLNFLWVLLFFGFGNFLFSNIVIILSFLLTFFLGYTLWNNPPIYNNKPLIYISLCVYGLFIYFGWIFITIRLIFDVITSKKMDQ